MNIFGFLFTLIVGGMLYTWPRRWASLALLLGAAYMTRGQVLELGPINLPVVRILVVIGFLRVRARGERIAGGLNILDKALLAWAGWLLLSGLLHVSDGLVFRLGIIWTNLGCYFLFRVFVQDIEDLRYLFKVTLLMLIPISAAMLFEKITGRNCFYFLGGVWEFAANRHGHWRAQGPFAHAILAGTVGAACFPMALFWWWENRKLTFIGLAITGGMVYASGSSGPFMTVFTIFGGMCLWKIRSRLGLIRWLALALIFCLHMAMKDPVYFLLARIDITGGSTGWHRAALIQSSIVHLNEWWLAGTDVTRHWMPTGVYSSAFHTDITNHYLQMGVWGGLPLLVLFIWGLVAAFRLVGKTLQANQDAPFNHKFLIWTLGCILFGHATNFFSVVYFDQSIVFLYFVFAAIGSLAALKYVNAEAPAPATPQPEPCLGVS